MSGLSRFGKKLGSIAGNATRKSGDLVETARLNSEINRLELDIEDLQFELGRAYYEENKNEPLGPYAQFIAGIRACEQEIRLCNEKLLMKKGLYYCAKCNAVVDATDEFCSKCGARVPVKSDDEAGKTCRNCGAIGSDNTNCCGVCGFSLKSGRGD